MHSKSSAANLGHIVAYERSEARCVIPQWSVVVAVSLLATCRGVAAKRGAEILVSGYSVSSLARHGVSRLSDAAQQPLRLSSCRRAVIEPLSSPQSCTAVRSPPVPRSMIPGFEPRFGGD